MKIKNLEDIFSRPFLGERVPQHIQNIIIREYCERNNFSIFIKLYRVCFGKFSLDVRTSFKELDTISGIVAYSLFQLPENKNQRLKIYNKILMKKKEIHFSVENLQISKSKDINKIEDIWSIRYYQKLLKLRILD